MKFNHSIHLRSLLCWGLSVLALLCSTSVFARAGLVQFATGEVSIWKRGGGESAAQKGSELYEGDTVVTGRSSGAQLLMVDGALISLRADTRLLIESYHTGSAKSGGDKALLNLVKGAIRSVSGSIGREKKADYSLRTETATIGIRGTDHECVFIPRPGSGERAPAEPGTYDKVNTGATVMESRSGRRLNVDQGETGFIGYDDAAPPKKVPDLPELQRPSDNRPPPPRDAARPTASKRLQVTVRFDSRPDAAINPAARNSSITSSRSDDVVEQRVQVQEGASAFIAYEQTRPGERSVTVSPFTKSVGEPQSQIEAASGFEVRPTLTPNGVSMAVSGRRISAGRTAQSSSSNERFSTTLTARLGEWVELGSRLTGGASASGEVTTSSRSVGANRDRVIWLRVDEAGR